MYRQCHPRHPRHPVAARLQVNDGAGAGKSSAGRAEISKKFGNCWVVLKGHSSDFDRAERGEFLSIRPGVHLAQGGSGDMCWRALHRGIARRANRMRARTWPDVALCGLQHGATADVLQTATELDGGRVGDHRLKSAVIFARAGDFFR